MLSDTPTCVLTSHAVTAGCSVAYRVTILLLSSSPATNYSLWLDESISMPKGSLGYCDLQFWFHCLIFKYLPYRCFVSLREHFRKCGVVAQHCKIAKVIIIQIF